MPLAGSQKLTEELGYSVARIECDTPTGVQCGTGFFFAFLLENGKRSPCLITSRHVVHGARSGRFFITRKDADGKLQPQQPLECRIADFEDKCHPHPDPSVDLVLIFVGANLQALKAGGQDFQVAYLSRSAILPPEQRATLAHLESVAVLGYPLGLWDPQQLQPVARLGITATHAGLPYGGACEFLIDVPCHPGLGGAPVFLCTPAPAGEGGTQAQRSPGVALLGVLYAQRHAHLQGETGVEPIVGRVRAGRPVPPPALPGPQPLGVVLGTDRILDFEPLVRAMVHGYVSKY
ncbi:serine protease [Pseudorhodoferax sp. Leaf274]|uniref:serine protease n=1 Tax=Pseudorhodoferax sp. Leaf274 TaxID=1736318 RepID=UPI000702A8F2|nr:serine protease [Pseudorhodoferax sp. Leaf274]KQP37015.1 hypothetical protein ASF44_14890 [Pseudorhodoferax sp. Leaf274]